MNVSHKSLLLALALTAGSLVRADVVPNALFTDHAVLQQGIPIAIWGRADEGEKVTVTLAGHSATAVAAQGKWKVQLPALKAGGPYTLKFTGKNERELKDILIGEVWVCGGQSNMERQLGLRTGQKPIVGWESAAAAANLPQVRHFGVAQERALIPQNEVKGQWVVANPASVGDFTAVGFFFGRALWQARGVPIGLIHASWGGTPAEAWTSGATLKNWPDYEGTINEEEKVAADPAAAASRYQLAINTWYAQHDRGAAANPAWSAELVPADGWSAAHVPGFWEADGLPDFDGIVWFRREFDVPASSVGAAELELPAVDDSDTTWINGVMVGSTDGWNLPRRYQVRAGVLHAGRNVIAVRVLDTGGGGGIWGAAEKVRLTLARGPAIALAGVWQRRVSASLAESGRPPVDVRTNVSSPAGLYNAMIYPLQQYGIRGVIWYQGEANDDRAKEYRRLFPALIADWRQAWGLGDFPFLFVQIAPFKALSPEIREAQLLTLKHTANTAMAITIDCGDPDDIHPANKQPVGERLALAARALAYGEKLEFSGPVFADAHTEGARLVLKFTHVSGGLVAPGGVLQGFAIAGQDHVWHEAQAEIRGDTVVVSSSEVAAPVAARYAWANVAQGNLYNGVGLPASPFRTDVD